MKTTLLSILAIIISLSSFSQYKIAVQEVNESFSVGSQSAFSVKIYETNKKDIEKLWKDDLKGMHAKVSMKKEIFADDASMKALGDNTFDVYAKINDLGDGVVELIVGVDLGGAFLNSGQHADKAKAFKDHLYNFAVKATKEGIRGLLKEAEKELEKMEKEQEGLVKDKEKLESNIENWKKEIEQAEKDIEQNVKDQETKKKEIEEQKKKVTEIAAKENAVK